MTTALCPKCSKPLTNVDVENVSGNAGHVVRLVAYVCPSCRTTLGVEADPVAKLAQYQDAVAKAKTELQQSLTGALQHAQRQLGYLTEAEARRQSNGGNGSSVARN